MTNIATQLSFLRYIQSRYTHRLNPGHAESLRDIIVTLEKLQKLRGRLIATASDNDEAAFDAATTALMDALGIDAAPVVTANEHREYPAVPQGRLPKP